MMIIALTLFLALLSILFSTFRFGISPMPSSKSIQRVLLEWIPEDFCGRILDLGCGWGNLLCFCRKSFRNAKLMGIEGSYFPFLVAKTLAPFYRMQIWFGNFFLQGFPEAEIILCYLCPYGMKKMKENLVEEIKRGATVICVDFAIPSLPPTKEVEVGSFVVHKVYLYAQSGLVMDASALQKESFEKSMADCINKERS